MSKDTIKRLMKYVGSIDEALDLIDEFKVKPKNPVNVEHKIAKAKPLKKTKAAKKGKKKSRGTEANGTTSKALEIVAANPNITVAGVTEKAGHKNDPVFITRFSASLARLHDKKILIRSKNEDGKFVYRKRAGLVQL